MGTNHGYPASLTARLARIGWAGLPITTNVDLVFHTQLFVQKKMLPGRVANLPGATHRRKNASP